MASVNELPSTPVAAAPGVVALPRPHSQRTMKPYMIAPRGPGLAHLVRETWRYRLLMGFIGVRYLQKRYARTWLGILWLPLRPGWNLATKILIFGGLLGVTAGKTPYPIFFIVANGAWQLFYECCWWSTRCVELNKKLVTSHDMPKLVLILAAFVPAFVDFLVNISFAAIGLLYYVIRAGIFYLDITMRTLILVPAGLAMMSLIGIAVGFFTSGASARARDIRFSIGYFLGFLQLLTPVIYPLSKVPPRYRPIAELNPLTGATEMVKDGLFGVHELSSDAIYTSVTWLVVLWVVGLWVYNRQEVAAVHGRRLGLIPRPRFRRAKSV